MQPLFGPHWAAGGADAGTVGRYRAAVWTAGVPALGAMTALPSAPKMKHVAARHSFTTIRRPGDSRRVRLLTSPATARRLQK
jgi:hypothetical protein